MDLVSVIVPAFNSAGTIKRSITSIMKQSYKEIEIIIVDDGSSDSTPQICKRMRQQDSRVIYYRKANGGVSSARNFGLEHMHGKYVCFVDADDFIEENMIEVTVRLMEENKTDMVVFGISTNQRLTTTPEKHINYDKLTKIQTFYGTYRRDSFLGYVWNKLFKTSIIKKNNLCFDEDIHFCEDSLFCSKYIDAITDSIYCRNSFYHYILNEDSISKQTYSEKRFTVIEACKRIITITDNYQDYELDNIINTELFVQIAQLSKMIMKSKQPHKWKRIHKLLQNMKGRKLKVFTPYCPMKYKVFYFIAFPFIT